MDVLENIVQPYKEKNGQRRKRRKRDAHSITIDNREQNEDPQHINHNRSMVSSRNQETSMFPDLNRSINKMEEQMDSINKKIWQVYNGRKENFDHGQSLERRKMLNKEAYELLKRNTKKEEIFLRK